MIRDIKLTSGGDIDLSNYSLELAFDADYISQKLAIVLRTFLGEWFLDTSAGIPYFEDILKKNYDPTRVEAVLKSAILDVPGVDQITAFDMNLEDPRTLVVSFTVNTDFGELEITEILT